MGDIVSVCSGKDYKHLNEGDIPVYGTGGYMLSVSEALSYFDDAIGIGRKGTIDKPYILKAPFWTVDTLFYAVPKEKTALDFVYCLFQIIDWKSKDESTGVPSLSKVAINSVDISIPKSEEQVRIGAVFFKIDNLITLHQRKQNDLFFLILGKKSSLVLANDWEQRKVSNMFKVTRGYVLAATLTSTDQSTETPYPVFSSQTKDKGLMGYYKDYLYEDAITWTTDGANAGTVNFRAGKFYCTNVCGVLLTDSVKASPAVAEALNNVAKRYVSYVGNPKLMNNVMADIEIHIPLVQSEQEKISQVFTTLDNLITLHQCKQAAFFDWKRCLYSKFDESKKTLAWEQRKLGDIGRVAMNRRIFKEQTSAEGSVPFYKIGTFGGEPDAFISDELYQDYKEHFPYPKVGDILLSASGSIGKMIEYKGEKAYFQDSNIVWLDHDASVSNAFLKCFYSVVKWAGLEGSTIKRLYNKNILETQIALPSYAEQCLIGDFFEHIDNLVTLHQRGEKINNRRQT